MQLRTSAAQGGCCRSGLLCSVHASAKWHCCNPCVPAIQVKKRCRWLLSFTQQTLRPISGSEKDPFDGADVDANALGWALAVVTSRAFRTRGPDQVRGRSSWGRRWLASVELPRH